MAMVTEIHRSAAVARGNVLARLLTALAERNARYWTFRRCVNELSALSTRELRDLGLHRSQIRSVAYEEAYRTAA